MIKSWGFEELGFTLAWSQDSCSDIMGDEAGKMGGAPSWSPGGLARGQLHAVFCVVQSSGEESAGDEKGPNLAAPSGCSGNLGKSQLRDRESCSWSRGCKI